MQITVRENLRERCLGDLEGLTRTEARTAAPEALQAFMKNDDFLPIPVRLALSSNFDFFIAVVHNILSDNHQHAQLPSDLVRRCCNLCDCLMFMM